MSHIYQPLLIKSLVEAGGSATIRQLAFEFLSQDESQLRYYEDKIKDMPLRVLRSHGIVENEKDFVTLNTSKLTYEQKAQVKMACEKRLQEYVQKRGIGIWDYRLLDTDPVPESIRYKVLKASDGRCELCGATKKDRPLDIDHIIPRSKCLFRRWRTVLPKEAEQLSERWRTGVRVMANSRSEATLF